MLFRSRSSPRCVLDVDRRQPHLSLMKKTPRLPRHELLTPDHACPRIDPDRGLCWHLYGQLGDGSRFAAAVVSDSSLGAGVTIREDLPGAKIERVVIGSSDLPAADRADYR